MKMSDKDFDQLFNSKLADMEAEPSTMVWDNITAELDGTAKKEKLVIPFMRIAAGIVVLMGASLFFLRPSVQKVALRNSNEVVQVEPIVTKTINKSATTFVANKVEDSSPKDIAVVKRSENASTEILIKEVKNAVDTTQILAEVNRKLAENVATPAIQSQQINTQSVIASNSNISQTKTTLSDKQAILASDNTSAQKSSRSVRRKGIHTLGDLLNVVIAQVDKRKDKVVEFTNDNDDDSFNITGINLGVLGAKKDK